MIGKFVRTAAVVVMAGVVSATAQDAAVQAAPASSFAGMSAADLQAAKAQRETARAELGAKRKEIEKAASEGEDIKPLKTAMDAARAAYNEAYDKSEALAAERKALQDADAAVKAAIEQAMAQSPEVSAVQARLADLKAQVKTVEDAYAAGREKMEGGTDETRQAAAKAAYDAVGALKKQIKGVESKDLKTLSDEDRKLYIELGEISRLLASPAIAP